MDADGGGSIGLEELENPLIGLGFADSREDVETLIKSVDQDGNGDIDFGEFCLIIKKTDRDEKSQQIYEFFKQMTKGSLKLGVSHSGNFLSQSPFFFFAFFYISNFFILKICRSLAQTKKRKQSQLKI